MSATDPRQRLVQQALARRSFLRAAGAAGLGLGVAATLAACGGDDAGSSTEGGESGSADLGDLVIQLSWIKNIEFAGEYFADKNGYYTDAGFSSVTLTAGGAAGTSAEAAVTTGKAFAGLSSPSLTGPAILEGAELKIVGATFQKNPFCIVSGTGNPIATPADMVGKKIGVQSGGNDTIFAALLAANDLDIADMTIVPVQYDPTVLTTGEVDGFMAYVTNEPILLAAEGFENTTFLFADNGLPFVNETLVVAQDSIDNERDKVKALLMAEIKGWTDALNDPEEGARLAVEEYGKDQNLELEEQIEEINAQADLIVTAETAENGIFTISDELVQESIDSLAAAGVTITADQLFDLSIVNEIYEENPDLITAVTYQPAA